MTKTKKETKKQHVSEVHPRNLKYLSSKLSHLVKSRLWAKIIIAMVLAFIVGFVFGPTLDIVERATADIIGNWIALPGKLFLTLVKMIIIPLVFASIIRGIASASDPSRLKKMGAGITVYFILTTALSIFIGVCLAALINPGQYFDTSLLKESASASHQAAAETVEKFDVSLETIPESLINILPHNPLDSMVNVEMFQVVLFAIFIGVALISIKPEKSKPILDLLGSLQAVCMTVVKWAMILVPYAVFGLLTQVIMRTGVSALMGIGLYAFTVILGLTVLFGIYLFIVYLTKNFKPRDFIEDTREVLLLAFSTSSSAAVMPLTIKTAEEKLSTRPSTSQFIIPLGTTINMDGTAMYQAVATMFLAQVYNVELGIAGILTVILISVASSVGAPGTPGVGIVVLSMVLNSVGIPLEGIALIIGIDRILDMCRTTLNVTGDLVACTVMDALIDSEQTLTEERETQRSIEEKRQKSGEDVITGKQKTKNA